MDATVLDGEWDLVTDLLPAGWRQLARETGALRRARGVASPDVLMRLLLMHAAGLSLRQASARAKEWQLASVSDVALLNRLRASELWLRTLTAKMANVGRGRAGVLAMLGDRRLRAIDATDIKEHGATGSSWRVHYSLTVPQLVCDFFEVTDITGGETYKRFPVHKGDVILGDRGYCHREGVAHVVDAGGDVVVRLNLGNLPLETPHGAAFDILAHLRTVKGRSAKEWRVRFAANGKTYDARLCAIRKGAAAAEKARKKIHTEAKKDKRTPRPETLESADYVFVLTTLPQQLLSSAQVLELYRMRWQIELAFKRLKSLMSAGHVPKYHGESARAWIQAKLLCVLLIERLHESARFSPWGYEIEPMAQPVA